MKNPEILWEIARNFLDHKKRPLNKECIGCFEVILQGNSLNLLGSKDKFLKQRNSQIGSSLNRGPFLFLFFHFELLFTFWDFANFYITEEVCLC